MKFKLNGHVPLEIGQCNAMFRYKIDKRQIKTFISFIIICHISSIENMYLQIAEGMAYLEKHNIVHQQLCAASIFVDEHKDLKVGNLGCYPRNKDMRLLDLQGNCVAMCTPLLKVVELILL